MVIVALVAALALSACGSSDKKSESSGAGKTGTAGANLDVTLTETGKTAKYTVPKSTKGGLTTLTFSNKGKVPHEAQLVRIEGGHTPQEALKLIAAQGNKVPDWLHAEGGLGQVPPGKTADANLVLDPGKYLVVDAGADSSGPPVYSQFTVAGTTPGSLPTTATTVTGAEAGKDKYRWDVSGELKSGEQNITFVSKGKNALHFLGAFRLNEDKPLPEVIKALKSQGKPPKFVDQSSFTGTAVIDGEKSQTTPLTLKAPGKWVLFCAITDRDGGKEHFLEGMIKKVDVK
jgi:uncharacterized cupredoxin-like copper-binding protein